MAKVKYMYGCFNVESNGLEVRWENGLKLP